MPKPIARLPKNLMGKKLGGEWVFLNLESGVYYGLNETGSLIWDELVKRQLLKPRSAAWLPGTARSARRRVGARSPRPERSARDELKKEKDTERVLDRLQKIFEVGRATLQKDLKRFLDQLKKEGLIEAAA